MQTNLQIYDMFMEINSECAKTGVTVMPITNSAKSINYYVQQMQDMGYTQTQIDKFVTFLQENA